MMKYMVEVGDFVKVVEAAGFVDAITKAVGNGYVIQGRHQAPGVNTYLLEKPDTGYLLTAIVTQFLPIQDRVYGLFIDGNLIELVNDAEDALRALGFDVVAARTLEDGGQEYLVKTPEGPSFIEALPYRKNQELGDTPDD